MRQVNKNQAHLKLNVVFSFLTFFYYKKIKGDD